MMSYPKGGQRRGGVGGGANLNTLYRRHMDALGSIKSQRTLYMYLSALQTYLVNTFLQICSFVSTRFLKEFHNLYLSLYKF